jgi:hypothetical protein
MMNRCCSSTPLSATTTAAAGRVGRCCCDCTSQRALGCCLGGTAGIQLLACWLTHSHLHKHLTQGNGAGRRPVGVSDGQDVAQGHLGGLAQSKGRGLGVRER